EPEIAGELGQGVEQAGHRRRVDALVAVGEGLRPALGLSDRLLAGWLLDVVEDLPVGGLDLILGVGGDLGEHVAGAMKPQRINVSTCRYSRGRWGASGRPGVPWRCDSGFVPGWRCARPVRGAGGSRGWRCRSRTGRP